MHGAHLAPRNRLFINLWRPNAENVEVTIFMAMYSLQDANDAAAGDHFFYYDTSSSSSPPLYVVRACGPINSALCHICTFVRESCTTGINTFGEYLLTATANPVRASRRYRRLHWILFGWRGKSVFRHPSSANYMGTRQQRRRRRRRRRKEDWRRIVIDLTWAKLF